MADGQLPRREPYYCGRCGQKTYWGSDPVYHLPGWQCPDGLDCRHKNLDRGRIYGD